MSNEQRRRLAFNLSTGADTGGAAIREVEAFDNPVANPTGEWEVRSMVAASNYIQYSKDLHYSVQAVRETYSKADVVHLNHTLHGHKWYDGGQGKPTVLEHHGLHRGAFDIDFEGSILAGIEIGAVQIGSTVNLELFGPPGTIEWAPIPYDLAALRAMRTRSAGPTVRVAHAPTNRAIKSTEAFLAAMASLEARGFKVETVLIEQATHEECLRAKATADILVDQLVLGYGCNAVEAWGMGLAVVGGFADPGWSEYAKARYDLRPSPTGLPFMSATEATLESVLERLILDADLRQRWADIGGAHVLRWHSQAASVVQMSKIYAETPRTVPSQVPPKGLSHMTRKQALQRLRANNKARRAFNGLADPT